MEEIISYIMETPENVNGNILREKLEEFKKGDGSSSVLDDLIERKSAVHLVSNAENVADAAFWCYKYTPKAGPAVNIGLGWYLETVDLPNAMIIGLSAFKDCPTLTSVNLPSATSIGDHAFTDCSALTSIDLPNVTSIGTNAFGGISSTAVINLGAAEGEISGAPWGAPEGVTINYNVRPTSE